MRFFRRVQRFAWLALFALAAQLVLSFGHIHVHAQQAAHAAALVIPAAAAETIEPQPSVGTHADSQTVHFLARAPPRAGSLA